MQNLELNSISLYTGVYEVKKLLIFPTYYNTYHIISFVNTFSHSDCNLLRGVFFFFCCLPCYDQNELDQK